MARNNDKVELRRELDNYLLEEEKGQQEKASMEDYLRRCSND